jgi:hypothetical protein
VLDLGRNLELRKGIAIEQNTIDDGRDFPRLSSYFDGFRKESVARVKALPEQARPGYIYHTQ